MISEPLKYVADFAAAGADIITFHVECDNDIDEVIDKIHSLGCKAGVALKPGTDASAVLPYLKKLEMVLVMTVEPGFGGQSFMHETMPKLKQIREKCKAENLDIYLQVDGGIAEKTVSVAAENGADVFVAGSAVFGSEDPKAAVSMLRDLANKHYC